MDSNKIYKKDLYLETENLILRPFRKEDRNDLVKNYNDSKVYSKNIPNFPYPYTLKDADTFFKKKRFCYKKKKDAGIDFAVFLKKENRVIGGVSLNHIDFKSKKCESGSCITKKLGHRVYF
ncbi:MAG: GNAT family N-acetyltransferase [Candidatus ainarchaeum sp.]|nr:GNAT family N-acetyltransferase [Candidatus ainarchaeum sp.]